MEPGPSGCFMLDPETRMKYLAKLLGGHGEMVSHEPSKLLVRVRFPLPAPASTKPSRRMLRTECATDVSACAVRAQPIWRAPWASASSLA